MKTEYLDIAINEIGQRYSKLRIIDPRAEAAMERSMRQYGQMTPVIVGRFDQKGYELVDGFKRRRAGEKVGFSHLYARIFPGNIRAAKAAMIQLNMKARSISDLETALVIRSLLRQDGLTQEQIAGILDRHPSWVCRRLSLVERLCEEVVENLKLGLINMTCGRELAKLPHGNQVKALKTVIDYNLNTSETARLVALLINEARWNHESILDWPIAILKDRQPGRPVQSKRLTFFDRLARMQIWMESALELEFADLSATQGRLFISVMDRIEEVFSQIRNQIDGR